MKDGHVKIALTIKELSMEEQHVGLIHAHQGKYFNKMEHAELVKSILDQSMANASLITAIIRFIF